MLQKLPSAQQQAAVVRLVSTTLHHLIPHPDHLLEGHAEENDHKAEGDTAASIIHVERLFIYLSSLLENFALGKTGLKCQLPLGKHGQWGKKDVMFWGFLFLCYLFYLFFL